MGAKNFSATGRGEPLKNMQIKIKMGSNPGQTNTQGLNIT
jgi:hypothetical protein